LQHTIDALAGWGVKEVLVNLHHSAAPVFDYVTRIRPPGMRVVLSYEPVILGTGGALRKAAWFLDDSCFWIVNGDIIFDLDPAALLRTFNSGNPLAALWMTDASGPRTVELSKGVVTSFSSAHAGTPGTQTFCGIHLVSPEILDYIPGTGFSSIIDAYSHAMRTGRVVKGVGIANSFWMDIGTLPAYIEAHLRIYAARRGGRRGARLFTPQQPEQLARLRAANVRINGVVSLGREVSVGRNSVIENSVVWNNVRIEAGSFVKNAVLADGVSVRGRITGVALRADAVGDPKLTAVLEALGWPPSETAMFPLPDRGSARTFTRIQRGGQSAIVVQYSLERPENALYVRNAGLLRKIGVPVPRIFVDMPDEHVFVMEDAGDSSLLDLAGGKPPAAAMKMYRVIMEHILLLHKRGRREALRSGIKLSEPFSGPLYRWERELFANHFLKGRLHLKAGTIREVLGELEHVADHLLEEPQVLIHRDLQSTNVLFRGLEPVFIDFQGMRFGPAMYDVASLLCDPYVMLPSAMQNELLGVYAGRMGLSLAEATESFRFAAVERLVQAIGAFGRLGSLPGTAQFAGHIQAGLYMLNRALACVDNLSHLKRVVCYAIENGEGK
jgi:NDP-sugar pyrophosphorylase family protein/aminoglycoside/choline kinase family phosphotransferase